MEIVNKKISEIKPYEKNPRINDDAVNYVANSIREFGFKVPIVIDSNGVIVAGHTRYKACKKLKYKEIPCVVADDLTDEQVNAFRLADNKVAEMADWDFDLLDDELGGIIDIDMSDFGFDFGDDDVIEDEPKDDIKQNERVRTVEGYNMDIIDYDEMDGFYQMPIIQNDHFIPARIKSFNYAKTSAEKNIGIHFYIDDYQFERVWNAPFDYIDTLSEYDCIFSPDFSLYTDMPMAMKIWNVYRSRLIGQFYQNCGIKVIPTISWCEKETFEFCFDGIPKGSVVSVSTIGVKKESEAFQIWKDGMDEMIKRIQPKAVLVYGGKVDYDYGKVKVVYFDNENTERMKEIKNVEVEQ